MTQDSNIGTNFRVALMAAMAVCFLATLLYTEPTSATGSNDFSETPNTEGLLVMSYAARITDYDIGENQTIVAEAEDSDELVMDFFSPEEIEVATTDESNIVRISADVRPIKRIETIEPVVDNIVIASNVKVIETATLIETKVLAPRTYTVKRGDSLAVIARKNLGSSSKWHKIASLNNLDNPNRIRVGQVLMLPGKASVSTPSSMVASIEKSTAPAQVASVSPKKIITIKRGDTLSKIARRHYGSADEWERIAHANGIDNPRSLRLGAKLVIPSRTLVGSSQIRVATIPEKPRVKYRTIKIGRGDTAYGLGKSHGVTTASILAANEGVDPRSLRVGQRLRIPVI